MRRPGLWLSLILTLLLSLVALWAAGPWLAMRGIEQALEQRDPARLERHVDFAALRVSLKAQLADRVVRTAGPQLQSSRLGGLALLAATSLVGASVDTVVTPLGISALLHGQGGWRKATGNTETADTHSPPARPQPFARIHWRYESANRFSASRQDGDGHITVFIFQRQQLRWRLVDIQLPPGWAAADVPG